LKAYAFKSAPCQLNNAEIEESKETLLSSVSRGNWSFGLFAKSERYQNNFETLTHVILRKAISFDLEGQVTKSIG
jgi:hypothetical protein